MRVLTILGILGIAVSSFAADDFDYKVANIDVLRDKAVQTELGITEGQRKTMNVFADTYSKANNEKVAEYQKAKKQPDQAFSKFSFDQYVKLRTSVLKTLSPNQIKRLREITLRAAGPRALLDKVVADKVGMPTPDYTKFCAAIREGDQSVAKIKKAVSDKVQLKYKNQKPPKTQKESDALRVKLNADLEVEMKKRQAEMQAAINASEAKTAKIVTKKYLDSLRLLMGKAFTPKAAAAPKTLGK